jgi:folate-binding protein YgfZ
MTEKFARRESFGNPLTEQRALVSGEAVVDLGPRAVIVVEGPDRLEWLHSMFSQNLRALKPGESAEALSLDPQGHIEQVLHIIEDGVRSWLVADTDSQAFTRWLDMRVFRKNVVVADRTSDFAVVARLNREGLPKAAKSEGLPLVWLDPWPRLVAGGVRYAQGAPSPWVYSESLIAVSELADALAEFEPAGTLALEALRVAARRPEFAREVDSKALPHEFDWMTTAVHMSKGCYRGQETVAKVHNLGHPPRRLVLLHLDGSGHLPPEHGDEVFVVGEDGVLEDKSRGHITSVGNHFEDGPIALALVSRSVPENVTLLVGKSRISASQEVIVPSDAGNAGNVREKRKLLMGGGH